MKRKITWSDVQQPFGQCADGCLAVGWSSCINSPHPRYLFITHTCGNRFQSNSQILHKIKPYNWQYMRVQAVRVWENCKKTNFVIDIMHFEMLFLTTVIAFFNTYITSVSIALTKTYIFHCYCEYCVFQHLYFSLLLRVLHFPILVRFHRVLKPSYNLLFFKMVFKMMFIKVQSLHLLVVMLASLS